MCLFEITDPKHYYVLWYKICNNTLKGNETYPKTVLKDFDMINNGKEIKTIPPRRIQITGKVPERVRYIECFHNTAMIKRTANLCEVYMDT